MTLSWKMGFEIEIMAPVGGTREELAQRIARRHNGSVRRFFHPQSEHSRVPGQPVFENLTLGFEVLDGRGTPIASFVDDLTLQRDFEKSAGARAGWYRIVADDARLLRLATQHCDASAPLETVLIPLAKLFGTEQQIHPNGLVHVVDKSGASIAIGAPLPGERERPCEIVTAPIARDHAAILDELLSEAVEEGCMVPVEGATHIHFDTTPLLSARVMARLVDVFWTLGDDIKALVGANTECVRLGRWPEALPELTRSDAFRAMSWPDARAALAGLELSKYCDYNILNIAMATPGKHTFEVRVLPTWLEAGPILEAAALFEAILRWCCDDAHTQTPAALSELLQNLPNDIADTWSARL